MPAFTDGLYLTAGQGLYGAATPGWPYRRPASGFQNYPVELALTQTTQTNQLLSLNLFTAPQTFTASNVTVATGGTAAGATPTLTRFGIYTIAGTTATLAANVANDTSKLTATFTPYTYPLAAAYQFIAGVDYYFGALVVTGATAPVLAARAGSVVSANSGMDTIFGSGFRIGCQLTGQSDLPGSFSITGTSLSGTNVAWAMFT